MSGSGATPPIDIFREIAKCPSGDFGSRENRLAGAGLARQESVVIPYVALNRFGGADVDG